MLSNSCRYGIRAIIYIASQPRDNGKTGIRQIAKDLDLPTPFLAKILQELAKKKILNSSKGPYGGFSLLKDPEKITLFEIVRTIDGDDVFTNCLIHNGTCKCVDKSKNACPIHDYYANIRSDLLDLFNNTNILDLVTKTAKASSIVI
jgi:Rrf2 family transcriptional regulator, iron-sulfur cluster assembly transcription factor